MKLLSLATALASSAGVANAFMGLRVPHANPAAVARPHADKTQMAYNSGFYAGNAPATTKLPSAVPAASLDTRLNSAVENALDNSQITETNDQIAVMTNAIAAMNKQIADMNQQIAVMSQEVTAPASAAPDAVVRTAVAAATSMSPVRVRVCMRIMLKGARRTHARWTRH